MLRPEYNAAATALKSDKIKLARVDCVDHADLCNSKGIDRFPVIKVFRNGQEFVYKGTRQMDGIVSYMQR